MPLYEYECPEHGRFTVIQCMASERKAECPKCHQVAEPKMSICSIRSAEPVTILQDLGTRNGQHLGYQEVGWQADSGISPKPGQPYKTPTQVAKEAYGGITEV